MVGTRGLSLAEAGGAARAIRTKIVDRNKIMGKTPGGGDSDGPGFVAVLVVFEGISHLGHCRKISTAPCGMTGQARLAARIIASAFFIFAASA
jgi:hypothetical protein